MKNLFITIFFLHFMFLNSCILVDDCQDSCSPMINLSFLDSIDQKDIFINGNYDIDKIEFINNQGNVLKHRINIFGVEDDYNQFAVAFQLGGFNCKDKSRREKFYIKFNSTEIDTIEFTDHARYYDDIFYNGKKVEYDSGKNCLYPLFILK